MKKTFFYVGLGSLLTLGAVHLGAVEGTTETLMGEVIDIAGYAMRDARGEEGAAAGKFRANGGFPVGILEAETGEIYVAVYKDPAPASSLRPANSLLAELMGKEVVVRGKVYRAKGVNVVEISVASEM